MPKDRVGRSKKLTPELLAEIEKHLRIGVTVRDICNYVGIGESTYYQWLAVGNAYLDGEEHNKMPRLVKDREALAEFALTVIRAQSAGMVHAVARFRDGMNPSESNTTHVEVSTETRLRTIRHPDGRVEELPYEHTKRTEKQIVARSPGDWRAAMEYLGRRNPEEWARQKIDAEITVTDFDKLLCALRGGELVEAYDSGE